jgi:Zn-dependent M28 family amino/carboxypeptidase
MATVGHFFVQEYIRQQLAQWGSVEIHTFEVRGKSCKNLILNLPASAKNQKHDLSPILIGTHYDGVPDTVAADDNATGVAVLLEFARSFAETPARYPLRLVAFDMEEYGLSSRDMRFLRSASRSRHDLNLYKSRNLNWVLRILMGLIDTPRSHQQSFSHVYD